jgi:hypothetical protein
MENYFSAEQIVLARQSFKEAERLTQRYFDVDERERKRQRYDVKTKAFLEEHEICGDTFAHLFKYELDSEQRDHKEGIIFYRICLQDDVILDAVKRATSFVSLPNLLLYIATHELVHVIRFERGEGDFYATGNEKIREEEIVHRTTSRLLKPRADMDMNLVLECFSDQYRLQPLS